MPRLLLRCQIFCLPCLYFLAVLTAQAQEAPGNRHVLMVSFDGFRSDYAERWQLPNFQRLSREGSSAESLLPVYPSKTFPNHYALVTGLYAGHHGLVDNSFHNRATGTDFAMSRREAVEDPRHYGGTPLWQHLQAHGILTASFFWVGSEVPIGGSYPHFWRPYDGSVTNEDRIRQVLDWLVLPDDERPRFITLYFSDVDSVAHDFGPDAPETRAAAQDADRLLGLIMAGLQGLPHPVELLVVSDHGMYPVRHVEASYIPLDRLALPQEGIRVVQAQTQVQLYLDDPAGVPILLSELQTVDGPFRALAKQDTPAHWHYNSHPNIGDILLVAEPGFVFTNSLEREFGNRPSPRQAIYGVHGYDATDIPLLHGIFLAWGPAIRTGLTIPSFENVHVFPFVTRLFGVPDPEDIDGRPEVLLPLLGEPIKF